MGRIVTIIFIILLIVAGVWWWRAYRNPNLYDGSVVRREAAMETGTTTMENGQNLGEAKPTPSRSDEPGTINGEPVNATREDLETQTTPITVDPYASSRPSDPDPTLSQPAYGRQTAKGYRLYPNDTAPAGKYDRTTPYAPSYATDSQPANAPNDVRFGASGIFQWYRQGNLTYRVNTRTGSSCVAYATLEEWRKPYVTHHRCPA